MYSDGNSLNLPPARGSCSGRVFPLLRKECKMFQMMNEYSDAIVAAFTVVVAFSTVAYVFLTRRLVNETRSLREAQTEPKINVTLESCDFAFNLVRLKIENAGLGPATDIRFDSYVRSGGDTAEEILQGLTEPNFFRSGMRFFGPGKIIFAGFTDMMSGDLEKKLASQFLFVVNLKSVTGKDYTENFILDMNELRGTSQLGKPNLYSIAKSLENIDKNFKHVIDSFQRIKVDVYSSEDRELETRRREAIYQEKRIRACWPQIIDHIKQARPGEADFFEGVELGDFDGTTLVLLVTPQFNLWGKPS